MLGFALDLHTDLKPFAGFNLMVLAITGAYRCHAFAIQRRH
jgi:hypothetical protein